MKRWKVAGLAAILVAAQGCTVAREELRHSGGYPGYRMDRRIFDAAGSKKIQLLRMTMILALASRAANATMRDGQEANAFIAYMRNATNEVNYLAAHLYGQAAVTGTDLTSREALYSCDFRQMPLPLPGEVTMFPMSQAERNEPAERSRQPCATYDTLFESDIPQLEYKIMRLVMAALPREQAAGFARAARTGNVASAAFSFLRLAAASVDALHRGAAVHRTNIEILRMVAQNPDECANVTTGRRPIGPVEQAVVCSGHNLEGDLFSRPSPGNWRPDNEIGTEPFDALFAVIRSSCALLPIDVETGVNTGAGPNGTTDPAEERQKDCATFRFRPTLRPGVAPLDP